jgi:formate hydrogenlyase subunit 6/NADH:ubiquinone oxidoreductase subunit I
MLLTRLSDGNYLAEIITPKGEALVQLAPELFQAGPTESKEQNIANVPQIFEVKDLADKLQHSFDKLEFWAEQSFRCLGCGACAFLCPICACFDIQDEGNQQQGKRLRCWDSCGFSLFTLHTSGHNPREVQNQRWRQRLMHKFSYMPERLGVLGCVGCGRCSRACPVDMNILEHIEHVVEPVP